MPIDIDVYAHTVKSNMFLFSCRYTPVHIARHGAFIVPQVSSETPSEGIAAEVRPLSCVEFLYSSTFRFWSACSQTAGIAI